MSAPTRSGRALSTGTAVLWSVTLPAHSGLTQKVHRLFRVVQSCVLQAQIPDNDIEPYMRVSLRDTEHLREIAMGQVGQMMSGMQSERSSGTC